VKQRNGGERITSRHRRVHFVGIGGIGMSGIAEVLLNLGFTVSGSDLVETESTQRLVKLGARVAYGHEPARITPDIDVVVTSSAVTADNPEVAHAQDIKIPVIPRAEMLAELMRMKAGVAVAGTHGKTTTTSLIATVLHDAGLDPTMVVGGKLRTLESNARLGQGEYLVTEADESDGSFLMLSPTVAVVTNIDPEHLDYYRTMDRVREAYLTFINRVPFYGIAVLCVDSPDVRALLPAVRKGVRTYGESPDADYTMRNVRIDELMTRFDVWRGDECLGPVVLNLPGRHHALNALATIVVADELGIPFDRSATTLSCFGGIHRRCEVVGEAGGVLVIDDYGHHPTEIAATIAAVREGFDRRLVAVFQPHRFTRTRDLFQELLGAFAGADAVVLTEIYPAGEAPIAGVTGEALWRAVQEAGSADVRFVRDRAALAKSVGDLVMPGDVVLVLGAGDVARCGRELITLLRERDAAGARPA
jgi:UDP-N-acetylmuramate--alanine ligase